MVSLDDIFDQPQAVEFLRGAWQAGRLPHGLLFAGPRGVGKATTAGAMAALFLCRAPAGARACDACESCRLVAAGNHPDYHVVHRQLVRFIRKEAKGAALAVDVVRQFLIEPSNRTAMMGHGRTFIIEEAHTMSAEAQNALLKTLEEPVGPTLVILVTDQPDSLLPTIRSRCQFVRFGALSERRVVEQLQRRGVERPLASAAARFAEGSLGTALEWIEDGVIAQAQALEERIDELLSGRLRSDPADWFKAAADAFFEQREAREKAQRQKDRQRRIASEAPAEDEAEEETDEPKDSTKLQVTREVLARYLRIASLVLRQRLAGRDDDSGRLAVCQAIEAIAQAERYLDANVTVSLIFQELAVTLEDLFVRDRRVAR
jgi:DNA polymerase III delta' subunit